MKIALTFFALCIGASVLAQPNCQAFLYYGDTLKYEACEKAKECKGHYQFSKEYQQALDAALEIDSTFGPAYESKSTAYLKSGDFLTWKRLIDKAVYYNEEESLGYRGWCRYQFFRDYQGAIDDIERLDGLVDHDIGYGANGDYHLHMARAICYKALGQKEKALEIMEMQLAQPDNHVGLYDYLHLGVVYLELDDPDKAAEALEKQIEHNDLAEAHFYLARCFEARGDWEQTMLHLEEAKRLYAQQRRMADGYMHYDDKVYLQDILEAQAAVSNAK